PDILCLISLPGRSTTDISTLALHDALPILGLHMFVSYAIAVRMAGRPPLAFFRDIQEAAVMAFSTASSNATLPTALRVADRMGLPPRVSRFVLTVGATANQHGTALFEGVT